MGSVQGSRSSERCGGIGNEFALLPELRYTSHTERCLLPGLRKSCRPGLRLCSPGDASISGDPREAVKIRLLWRDGRWPDRWHSVYDGRQRSSSTRIPVCSSSRVARPRRRFRDLSGIHHGDPLEPSPNKNEEVNLLGYRLGNLRIEGPDKIDQAVEHLLVNIGVDSRELDDFACPPDDIDVASSRPPVES